MPYLRLVPDLRDPGWRESRLRALAVVAALGALMSVLPFFARFSHLFELAANFRLQYAATLGLAAMGLALGKDRRPAVVIFVFALWNAGHFAGDYLPPDGPAPVAGAPRLKLVSFNVHSGNEDPAGVRAFLAAERPDLLLILELSAPQPEAFGLAALGYETAAEAVRLDNFGIGLYVRRDGAARLVPGTAHVAALGGDEIPSITAELAWGAESLHFVGVHSMPPMSAEGRARRDLVLRAAGQFLQGSGRLGVLAGDFNATPWSPIFGELTKTFGLRDSRRGFGAQASWPTGFFALRIPIDHVLTTPGVAVLERRIGPDLGSDHHPVVVTLAPGEAPR